MKCLIVSQVKITVAVKVGALSWRGGSVVQMAAALTEDLSSTANIHIRQLTTALRDSFPSSNHSIVTKHPSVLKNFILETSAELIITLLKTR